MRPVQFGAVYRIPDHVPSRTPEEQEKITAHIQAQGGGEAVVVHSKDVVNFSKVAPTDGKAGTFALTDEGDHKAKSLFDLHNTLGKTILPDGIGSRVVDGFVNAYTTVGEELASLMKNHSQRYP